MGRLTLPVDVDWKVAAAGADTKDDAGSLEGYAAVYGVVGEDGDVVTPGAFKKSAADWSRARQPLPLIADHELSSAGVIGSVHRLRDERVGLHFKARFARTDKAQDVRSNVLDGHLRGTSFTAEVLNSRPGSGAKMSGKDVRRYLDEMRLFEVTISPFPIYPAAGITTAKAQAAATLTAEATGLFGRTDLDGAKLRQSARDLLARFTEADLEPPEPLRLAAGMLSTAAKSWADSMGHALAIPDEFAKRAAVEELVASYPTQDLGAATDDGPGTPADAAGDTAGTSNDGDDGGYARSIVAKSGPSDGTPDEVDADVALPPVLAQLYADRSVTEIDQAEAALRALGGPT